MNCQEKLELLPVSKLPLGSETTLVDISYFRAVEQAEREAYCFLQASKYDQTSSLSYAELHAAACQIAVRLQELGLERQRALMLYPPGLEFVTAFFGCLYSRVIAVPAYPPRRNQNLVRLQSVVLDADVSVILTTSELMSKLHGMFEAELGLNQLPWISTDSLQGATDKWCMPAVAPDDIAFLQYTSGSTGNPKGVMVNHGNLMHNLAGIYCSFEHSFESKGFIWLPPYHDMGLIGGVLQPLYGGFPVTLMSPVDFLQKPIRWLQAISHYKATTSGAPNFAYDLCLQKIKPEQLEALDLSSWDVAFTGAEPIHPATLDRFTECFSACGFRREAFYPCYGMAESTLIISGGLKSKPPVIGNFDAVSLERNKAVSVDLSMTDTRSLVGCGPALPDTHIAIVHPDTQKSLPEGQIGEIWVSSKSISKGYWNNSEETEQTFHACLDNSKEKNYLRTGDLGFIYKQEIFVTGRCKDLIIIRGQNHYPQDIELTVEQSHVALRSNAGAAFSVEYKSSEHLVVVQELKRTALRSLDSVDVLDSIRQAVTRTHGLDIFAIVLVKTGSILKTSSGKIRRRACREAFLQGSLNVINDWSKNPRITTNFLNLEAEIESVLKQVNK